MKKAGKIFLGLIAVLLIAVIAVVSVLYTKISPVSKDADAEAVRFEISYGSSNYEIAHNLKVGGIIKDEKLFYYSTRLPKILQILYSSENVPDSINFKSGVYYVKNNMNYAQLVNLLSSGQQEYVKVSIPEGYTITKIGNLLEENGICTKDGFKAACYDSELLAKYKIPAESAEGYLFPDTYFFTVGMSDAAIAEFMIQNFFDKIKTVPGLLEKTPEELHEIVILSSIVEREYRQPDEAPLIASVFTNRLKKNIGLYSCATIIYIITEIQGRPHPDRVLYEDTAIDSPYNTYKWAGLTPGPISNPGLVSLNASANPPKTNYYFFQVVDAAAGRHVFTSTFDEHKAKHNLSVKE